MAARRKRGRRNPIAKALKHLAPKIVAPRKGSKAYRRKPKHPNAE